MYNIHAANNLQKRHQAYDDHTDVGCRLLVHIAVEKNQHVGAWRFFFVFFSYTIDKPASI